MINEPGRIVGSMLFPSTIKKSAPPPKNDGQRKMANGIIATAIMIFIRLSNKIISF